MSRCDQASVAVTALPVDVDNCKVRTVEQSDHAICAWRRVLDVVVESHPPAIVARVSHGNQHLEHCFVSLVTASLLLHRQVRDPDLDQPSNAIRLCVAIL
jgi:UDP-N-acetyl-D-mannosaminuronate dehydrogenase